MQTAEEMYDFIIEYGYGKGNSESWGLKHLGVIEQSLQPDEDVILCFIGLHNKDGYNFAYAITDSRMIIGQKKLIGEVVQTIYLDNLNDVTFKKKALSGIITFDTIKETLTVTMPVYPAKLVYEGIQEVLNQIRQSKNNANAINTVSTSAADELLKFKQLLDMGVISQEEFEQKKKQLLDL